SVAIPTRTLDAARACGLFEGLFASDALEEFLRWQFAEVCDRVPSARLTIRPLSSVQPELAVDRADLGRLDQPGMRHSDRVQRAFQGLQPEIEEFVEHRKCRAEIVILPDIALQQPGVIRPPVENV